MEYSFRNDYSEGSHPDILKALISNNLSQQEGYGDDEFCKNAAKNIRKLIANDKADIHFVSGGTQANLLIISSILRPYESVIAPNTAHIEIHETGAIESVGHKINLINTDNGKIYPHQIQEILDFHVDEHMVKPKLVFISNSTEIGSVYTKAELKSLSVFCKKNSLYLYLDGARLGAALCSPKNDLSIAELSDLLDVFYIGGTKNGALIGEAIVINNDKIKTDFRFMMKQKGALLAKSRIIGIQFNEFFKENLYFELAQNANNMALKLADGIKSLGYKFLTDPESNQIFPILPNKIIKELEKKYGFYIWKPIDKENSAIRLVTSWATKDKEINEFTLFLSSLQS